MTAVAPKPSSVNGLALARNFSTEWKALSGKGRELEYQKAEFFHRVLLWLDDTQERFTCFCTQVLKIAPRATWMYFCQAEAFSKTNKKTWLTVGWEGIRKLSQGAKVTPEIKKAIFENRQLSTTKVRQLLPSAATFERNSIEAQRDTLISALRRLLEKNHITKKMLTAKELKLII